jgi:hypothetical protein
MTFSQMITELFTPLLHPFSFFIITLIGTMLGGLAITQGNGGPKLRDLIIFNQRIKY